MIGDWSYRRAGWEGSFSLYSGVGYNRTPTFHPRYDLKIKVMDILNKCSGRTGFSDHFPPTIVVKKLLT